MEEKTSIAFFAFKRTDGFEVSLTFRGDSGTEVLEKVDKSIEAIKAQGGTPVAKSNGFPARPVVPSKPCPIHPDKQLKERESKDKPGEKYWSHSKGLYPNFGEWCNGKGYPSELPGENLEQINNRLNGGY